MPTRVLSPLQKRCAICQGRKKGKTSDAHPQYISMIVSFTLLMDTSEECGIHQGESRLRLSQLAGGVSGLRLTEPRTFFRIVFCSIFAVDVLHLMVEGHHGTKEVLRRLRSSFLYLSLLVTDNLENETPELCPLTSFGKKCETVPCEALWMLVSRTSAVAGTTCRGSRRLRQWSGISSPQCVLPFCSPRLLNHAQVGSSKPA